MPKPTICKHCQAVNSHYNFQCYKVRKPIRSNTKLNASNKEQKQSLNVFFASQALVIPKHCENCLKPLILTNSFERRSVIAHILPKSEKSGFPSISTHPQNRMFLGKWCGCHGNWDNKDADARKQMNCYKIALERFREFEELLTGKELIKAYKYLGL